VSIRLNAALSRTIRNKRKRASQAGKEVKSLPNIFWAFGQMAGIMLPSGREIGKDSTSAT